MAYALVHDLAASWPEYRRLVARAEPIPRGLLLQAAGPTDEGVRVIGIWRSELDWLTYGRERHMHACELLGSVRDPLRSFRAVPAVLLLIGELVDGASRSAARTL